MTKESQTETFTFTCSLDDTWDISHNETLVVTIADNTQRWFHCCERIVGYLRLCT